MSPAVADLKGYRLYVNLGASQVRRRLKGFGHGVRKVRTAGKNQAVIIHTATGQHLRELEALFDDVYVGQASPDPLVIDYDVIRLAPRQLNIAGLGDILSIHTATRDWELAAAAGRDAHSFSEDQVRQARHILTDTLQLVDDLRNTSDVGLQAIVNAYLMINELCLPVGHYRVEDGSEHYLFYELEKRLRRPFVHGQIVGLGIYLMSRLQENAAEWITATMGELRLAYHPVDLGISREQLVASLRSLRSFVAQRALWYTVIDEREMHDTWLADSLERLRF